MLKSLMLSLSQYEFTITLAVSRAKLYDLHERTYLGCS
jgi:hypothetical protein